MKKPEISVALRNRVVASSLDEGLLKIRVPIVGL
jgi:hypothetical protein